MSSWILGSGPGPGIGENSFQINGDGFINEQLKIAITTSELESNFYARGIYNYFEEYKNMVVRVSGLNSLSKTLPISGIHIDFRNFVNPGIYKVDSAVSVSIFFKKDIPSDIYDNYYMFDSNGEINIQKYEPIGGLIEGTFYGTFVKMKLNSVTRLYEETEEEVRITNGKFSVVHQPDYHWDAPISNGIEPLDFNTKKKKENAVRK